MPAPNAPTPERVAHELRQAHEELEAASSLLQKELLDSATSSTYYACFHAARALLYHHGVLPITHKGVAVEFSRRFVKTGILTKEWSKILEALRTERQLADYHAHSRSLTLEQVKEFLVTARRFVAKMEELVNRPAVES